MKNTKNSPEFLAIDVGTSKGRTCCGAMAIRNHASDTIELKRTSKSREEVTRGMVEIPAGPFRMGGDDPDSFIDDAEGPVREVQLAAYLIDIAAVTNRDFSVFVKETNYVTDAELEGWSFVFFALIHRHAHNSVRHDCIPDAPWWVAVNGACWSSPEGPGSDVEDRLDHPAVHISWRDAASYASWAGKRLPTEAEWEKASRGGLQRAKYPWGDEFKPHGLHQCNTWQGRFPEINTGEDGFIGTCPVDAFEPNGYGLYNTSGNVWEWCADWWDTDWHFNPSPATRVNPIGPTQGAMKVIRGGSYLCHSTYCNRYRVSARSFNGLTSSTGHMGFRCAADVVPLAAY